MSNNRSTVTWLYVDGTNFFKGFSELLPPGEYIEFSEIIKCVEKRFSINKIKFYSTYFKQDPSFSISKSMKTDAQISFLDNAKNVPKLTFIKGYLSSSGKEKGIDMKMGVDLVKDAYEGSYDEAIVMSGDDDFIYAINVAKAINKPVHMCTVATRYGFGTAMNCYKKLILDYKNYFINNVQPTLRRPPRNLEVMDISKLPLKKSRLSRSKK